MWQRVQTLYLAIATILLGTLFFSKMATIVGPNGEDEIIKYTDRIEFLLFSIMVFTANALSLFSFKTRILQMRVTMISSLLLVAFQIWLGVFFFMHKDELVFAVSMTYPTIALTLNLLAIRNIMLDEAMVQSASRLRSAKRKKK